MSDWYLYEEQLNGHDSLSNHDNQFLGALLIEQIKADQLDNIFLEDHHENDEDENGFVREWVIPLDDFGDKTIIKNKEIHQKDSESNLNDVQEIKSGNF